MGATPSTELQDAMQMPGYAEADLIQARKPIKDQAGRDFAFCTLGHLEAEQRETATSDRAETIRALQASINTFDGVEPESEATPTEPAPAPQPTASGPSPAPVPPLPPAPPLATDGCALGEASMRRTLARAGITPVGGQQAPAGKAGGDTSLGASMRRTLKSMGITPQESSRS